MTNFTQQRFLVTVALLALALLALALPALAASGDYGVSTGASAQSASSCGGRGQPACSITYGGYTATFRTISGGYAVYSFSFSCELLMDTSGNKTVTGSQCSQYLNTSSSR